MSDLIDRQAAIDALGDYMIGKRCPEDGTLTARLIENEVINKLPPALREQHHDEWCTDCKEYDHENSCCHRWTKVIRQTRRELQDEFVMTAVDGTLWVTVDDVQKVGRVIVDEEKSKFCKQFYMDAQPEQRTGEWIDDGDPLMLTCGNCGYGVMRYNNTPFCPNCGAKMEGDAE